MNEFKKNISRSFERKVSLGDYNMASFFASYSEEIPADTDPEAMQRISALLYGFAKLDVEEAIIDYKNEKSKVEAVKRIETGGWPKEND